MRPTAEVKLTQGLQNTSQTVMPPTAEVKLTQGLLNTSQTVMPPTAEVKLTQGLLNTSQTVMPPTAEEWTTSAVLPGVHYQECATPLFLYTIQSRAVELHTPGNGLLYHIGSIKSRLYKILVYMYNTVYALIFVVDKFSLYSQMNSRPRKLSGHYFASCIRLTAIFQT